MTVVDSVTSATDSFVTAVNAYAATHHDGIVALLLITGVVVAFSGRALLRPTVFLLGFIPATSAVATMGLSLAQDLPSRPRPLILNSVLVVVSLAVGVLIGIIMLRLLFRIATFVLCAGFGAVLVFVIHLFLLQPARGPNAFLLLYAAQVLAALVAGLFSVSYPKTGVILGTSFDGAALAVFSLSRFLGHRPRFVTDTSQTTAISATSQWWGIGYGVATLILGVFGAMNQRQVAKAEAIIFARAKEARLARSGNGNSSSVPYAAGEEQRLLPFEPPRTPPHLRSGHPSPGGNSSYGAIDQEDSQYSVVHNLGAGPLNSGQDDYKNGKDTGGPL